MGTTALVSVEEYLATVYRPDCDYVDGVVLERNMGEFDHARLQMLISVLLFNLEKRLGVKVLIEQRVQVKPTRFRIPDICAVDASRPKERILTEPPFLCVEILSPEDRAGRVMDRVLDFLEMGVRYVWVINTENRRAWIHTPGQMREVTDGILRTENPEIALPLADLFAQM